MASRVDVFIATRAEVQADQALTLAGLSASWVALSGGTWKLFEIADKAASRQASDFVGAWLRRETGTPAGNPVRVATRHSPWDSPAVSNRSILKHLC